MAMKTRLLRVAYAGFLQIALSLLFLRFCNPAGAEQTHPNTGASQNCGAVALAQLAHALQLAPDAEQAILKAPAPPGGFSLAELKAIGAENGLHLEAVRLAKETEIPIPCIVHWKIGHYGVIVAKRTSHYQVLDGLSGRGVWLSAQLIHINGSGAFLVAEQAMPTQWQQLSPEESALLRAGHLCNDPCTLDMPDDEDPPTDCCDDNDDQDADCDPPSANDGPSEDGDDDDPTATTLLLRHGHGPLARQRVCKSMAGGPPVALQNQQ